ncbi:hypothetical protein [Specibacter sp. RAF43]|uniref:hypothetical protein n=1 Tax=Specibacter sp. RAF43 TaxID=3233057 RepID=UPI003F9E4CBF
MVSKNTSNVPGLSLQVPQVPRSATLSKGARYGEVAANVRGLTAEHHINGLHVHVGIPNRAAGVWPSTTFAAGSR